MNHYKVTITGADDRVPSISLDRLIRDIGPRDPYWIDMESGVRTDDKLDLAKVRRVLEQIATLTIAPGEGRDE